MLFKSFGLFTGSFSSDWLFSICDPESVRLEIVNASYYPVREAFLMSFSVFPNELWTCWLFGNLMAKLSDQRLFINRIFKCYWGFWVSFGVLFAVLDFFEMLCRKSKMRDLTCEGLSCSWSYNNSVIDDFQIVCQWLVDSVNFQLWCRKWKVIVKGS
jgi:hypothetical protein